MSRTAFAFLVFFPVVCSAQTGPPWGLPGGNDPGLKTYFDGGAITDLPNGFSVSTLSAQVAPAPAIKRWRATVNNSTTSTDVLWCRADGGVAVSGVGIRILIGAGYEWDYPAAGSAAINCVCASGTCGVSGELAQ